MRHDVKVPLWKLEAFIALSERLKPIESALHGGRLLVFHCDPVLGVGLLLDWLRPYRLVAFDLEEASDGEPLPRRSAWPGCGPQSPFDAVFIVAHDELKRALRRVSLSEIGRVLSARGLLVVASVDPSADLQPDAERDFVAQVRRNAEAWNGLRRALPGAGFEISDEFLGASRVLIARRRNTDPLSSGIDGEPFASPLQAEAGLMHRVRGRKSPHRREPARGFNAEKSDLRGR